MNEFREILQKISRGEKLAKDLTREEAYQAILWIFEGQATEFQTGAFFSAMRMKSESAEETIGFVEAVRERAIQLYPKQKGIVDFGDPYDGKVKTLHLTLPVALVLSAAGIPVVLHSTPETPVKKGVETQGILEALGFEISSDPDRLLEILEKEKIVFLPTARLAPDFSKLRPYREQFGLRPFANHIEKILNLANADTRMVGIYHRPYLEMMAQALAGGRTRHAFVIQGVEGFTELFLSRKTLVLCAEGGKTETLWLDPAEFGLGRGEEETIEKSASSHARRIIEVLEGKKGPAREGLLWNAAVKLFWMKRAKRIEEGLELAREILDSGKALAKLEAWKDATQESKGTKKI